MDPITFASRRFLRELRDFWEPPPGVPLAPGPRVLRLVASASDRGDMMKSLRLLEQQPDNRRPLLLIDAPFETARTYLAALAAKLREDHRALQAGLAEDGAPMPDLAPLSAPASAASVAAWLAGTAEALSPPLAGLYVALSPSHVADVEGYAALVQGLAGGAPSAALRLCVLDTEGAHLDRFLAEKACFEVDREALFAFLKQLGGRPSAGPNVERPSVTPLEKRAIEAAAGARIASADASRTLRVFLLDAGKALEEGDARSAVRHLRAARMLCHTLGLTAQACVLGIGVGSAQLTLGDERAALFAYQQAKEQAEREGFATVAAQAAFGLAGVHVARKRHVEAVKEYDEVERLAADMPPLAEEARRMRAQCIEEGRLVRRSPRAMAER